MEKEVTEVEGEVVGLKKLGKSRWALRRLFRLRISFLESWERDGD